LSSATLSGVHHVTFPVSDLDASIKWYEDVLGAKRNPAKDHLDDDGKLFAVIVKLPGLNLPVQLRVAPDACKSLIGFAPVTLSVADRDALDHWAKQLDARGVEHSPVIEARAGHSMDFHSPDGMRIQLYTDPEGGNSQ
jgi:catechol 2,3-dioxygenase-like lactoylglutathione lyase family enzyme